MARQSKQVFLASFVVSFFVSILVLVGHFQPVDDLSSPDDPANPWMCGNVAGFNVSDDQVTITYTRAIPVTNPDIISRHFALNTSWLGQRIQFRTGSAEIISIASRSITLRFHLPVIANYSANLFCINPDPSISKNWETIAPFILRSFDLKFSITDFLETTEYSQLRCHHAELFQRRWCEARNLVYYDRRFFFLSPASFEFPEPFIAPGPRAPPFDKVDDQFVIEPIILPFKFSKVPRNLTVVTDFCYIYGVFYNYYMLWHTVFDFIIPLHHFMTLLNRSETARNRRVYVKSDGVWSFHAMMKVLSDTPITIISNSNPSIIMRDAVIGIEKLEKNVSLNRTYDDSIGFHYDFDRSTAPGLRNDVLNSLNIPTDIVGKAGKPLALLIEREGGSRNIRNTHEIFEAMVEGCPHCQVEMVRFHHMGTEEQIRVTSTASALVGLHGSGLTHVVWMSESRPNHTTHLVEFLPYRYLCRNWYHTAADVAGVNYHMVMNQREPENVTDLALRRCWKNPGICATLGCHDLLRDQPTTIEMDTFNATWLKIAEELKSTIPTGPV
jgi:hypothetical protein